MILAVAATILAASPAGSRIAREAGAPAVTTGLESLIALDFAPLKGKRIGLVTNPTGITSGMRTAIDVLSRAPDVKLVALFGPEHGVRGDAAAGAAVANARDAATGLPVYSLYGKTTRPTAGMLRGIDALVFDMQDIGSRSYTYVTTMGRCMEACAANNVTFIVLDRPNPLGGERIEGNITESGFRSTVGAYPIAYRHGMTVGELARMMNGEGWLPGGAKCDLRVIPMRGWRRSMSWDQTGLPWVPTSPHVPRAESALFYAATGIVGELSSLSIGVGYPLPFELAGAPGVGPEALARELNRRRIGGAIFRPASWRPYYGAMKGQLCGGVQIYLAGGMNIELTRLNFEIMDALRKVSPGRNLTAVSSEETRMFDLSCGTDKVRKAFNRGSSSAEIWAAWNADAERFRAKRRPYLLYP
jgi:uncharacterized protein YbbC (DUF1343 family)